MARVAHVGDLPLPQNLADKIADSQDPQPARVAGPAPWHGG